MRNVDKELQQRHLRCLKAPFLTDGPDLLIILTHHCGEQANVFDPTSSETKLITVWYLLL